jgi:hypothetical protein
MKKIILLVAACCGFAFISPNRASAQNLQPAAEVPTKASAATTKSEKAVSPNTPANDFEILKHRIEEIENQNRQLLQMVSELKARLDGSNVSEANSKSAPAAATAPPKMAPANQTAQAPASQPDQPVRWSEIIGEGNRIKLYGFLRLDLDMDSQRPNNTQTPLFITSPDASAGGSSNGDFSMHPRLTRFGVDYTGPRLEKLGNAKLSGKLETDFENGGSESRQIIRIRHAYLRMDWSNFALLAGQTWDTVSPLFPTVNNDTLQWNAGNVGDRRPQLRAAYEPKAGRGKFSFIGGIGLTGAIDGLDLDNNTFRDGEESHLPNYQGRIGYSHPLVKDQMASFGLSGFYGFLKTSRPIAGRTNFHAQLLNVDFTLPLAGILALRGEGWWGRNMSDVRGGAGQGINTANGREIRGRGGWSELGLKASRYLSINPGFSTDDPIDGDVPGGGRTRNQAFYIANRITPGGNFLIGADYLHWLTNFKGLRRGVDNRVNLFLQYSF